MVYWVCATGARIDISFFLRTEVNIVWDNDELMRANGLLDGSGAILLRAGTIDTIVPMRAVDLEGSLAFVSGWIEENGAVSP